jgi:hypothetical protein
VKLNTQIIFKVAKLVKYFEKDVDVIKNAFTNNDDGESFFTLLFKVISSLPEAQDDLVDLVALANKMDRQEVLNMDMYEFVSSVKEVFTKIDWKRLLGECLGLTLPVKNEKQEVTLPE